VQVRATLVQGLLIHALTASSASIIIYSATEDMIVMIKATNLIVGADVRMVKKMVWHAKTDFTSVATCLQTIGWFVSKKRKMENIVLPELDATWNMIGSMLKGEEYTKIVRTKMQDTVIVSGFSEELVTMRPGRTILPRGIGPLKSI